MVSFKITNVSNEGLVEKYLPIGALLKNMVLQLKIDNTSNYMYLDQRKHQAAQY